MGAYTGLDKSKPLILNTPEATKCLALYTEKAKELNGQNYDILKNDVSSKALYDSSNGKPHGTWSLFNGIVNDIEVIVEVRATGTSSAALKRRRAEEIEDVRRKESEKTRKAEAYASNLLSWGVGILWQLTNECLLEKYHRRRFHLLLVHFLLLDLHNDLLSKF